MAGWEEKTLKLDKGRAPVPLQRGLLSYTEQIFTGIMPTTWRAQPIGTTAECWYSLHPDPEQDWLHVRIGQTMSHASTANSSADPKHAKPTQDTSATPLN